MAFASSALPAAALRSSSFTGNTVASHRAPVAFNVRSRRVSPVSMAVGDEAMIDFGKLNIKDVGSNFAGLVFKPESESEGGAIETRVDVGYVPAQVAAVNRHINVEYTASYVYHAIWAYFDRDTVALPGFARFFKEQTDEEREHAEEFMKFQNTRGGQVELQPLAVPQMSFTYDDGTSDAVYAMDLHLQLEKFVYYKLKDLHKVAEEADDPQMQDFVEDYLGHQIEAIKKAGDYIAQLKRVATPHGVWHFDRYLMEECKC